MRDAVTHEALKAAPPVAVSAWAWAQGFTLNQAVALATLAYIGLQAAYLIWKWYREYKKGKR